MVLAMSIPYIAHCTVLTLNSWTSKLPMNCHTVSSIWLKGMESSFTVSCILTELTSWCVSDGCHEPYGLSLCSMLDASSSTPSVPQGLRFRVSARGEDIFGLVEHGTLNGNAFEPNFSTKA